MVKQRYTFRCWQCAQNYTLFLGIIGQQKVTVACPYCGHEGVLDLTPPEQAHIKEVMRGAAQSGQAEEILDLPAILPTRKKDCT